MVDSSNDGESPKKMMNVDVHEVEESEDHRKLSFLFYFNDMAL